MKSCGHRETRQASCWRCRQAYRREGRRKCTEECRVRDRLAAVLRRLRYRLLTAEISRYWQRWKQQSIWFYCWFTYQELILIDLIIWFCPWGTHISNRSSTDKHSAFYLLLYVNLIALNFLCKKEKTRAGWSKICPIIQRLFNVSNNCPGVDFSDRGYNISPQGQGAYSKHFSKHFSAKFWILVSCELWKLRCCCAWIYSILIFLIY